LCLVNWRGLRCARKWGGFSLILASIAITTKIVPELPKAEIVVTPPERRAPPHWRRRPEERRPSVTQGGTVRRPCQAVRRPAALRLLHYTCSSTTCRRRPSTWATACTVDNCASRPDSISRTVLAFGIPARLARAYQVKP